jgi:hypothetical protein
MIKKCIICGEYKEHHAKGLCYACYKKTFWKPKNAICKRCGKEKEIHAKGLCSSCYNNVYHSENNKAYSQRKKNGIDVLTYKRITERCIICGFDKIIEIHHIDFNKKNNSKENLIGLCPNHHRMANSFRYRYEVYEKLKEKGFSVPLDEKYNFYNNRFRKSIKNTENKAK